MATPFEHLFYDPVYLELKNSLFSYLLRRRLLRGVLKGLPDGSVLDLGSGISPVVPVSRHSVYSDSSASAMRLLRSVVPGGNHVALDATALPFRDGSLELAVCSEVLEHIQEDELVLREIHRVLRPRGRLVLTVPIHPYYYTFDDAYVGHVRRYRREELSALLVRIGFTDITTRKVAGFLEKAATYAAVRLFAFLGRKGGQGVSRGRLWWVTPYRLFNHLWSYVAGWEGQVSPWALTTIILVDSRRS